MITNKITSKIMNKITSSITCSARRTGPVRSLRSCRCASGADRLV
jgi:hypothetical protein